MSGSRDVPHPFPRPFDADAIEERLRTLDLREPFVFSRSDVPAGFQDSSVLLLFWREADDLRVLLTRRAAHLRGHPGQMAFPGGRLEPGEGPVEAALRETEEEVGLSPQSIEVLGRLDDAWSGAGHRLVPVVGWMADAPECTPNPEEVAEVHTPSGSSLFAPDAYRWETKRIGDQTFLNSTLHWGDDEVFGLSTELLIEAIQWGLGVPHQHGRTRLENLHAYLRVRSAEERANDARTGRAVEAKPNEARGGD